MIQSILIPGVAFQLNSPSAGPPPTARPAAAAELGPTPRPMTITHADLMRSLNPLQHLPGIGMIYRAVTGETIPAPLQVLGAGIVGGPLGALGAGFMAIMVKAFTSPPDTSRPAVPAGMSVTGTQAGMQPVTPGTLKDTAYTTLATLRPEWLPSTDTTTAVGEPQRGAAAYLQASTEYQRTQMLEKGLG